MSAADQPGIDVDAVSGWMRKHVPDCQPPLTFRHITGGRSNLTFGVEDSAAHAWALRRPPTGGVLATAHDMSREWRFITALAASEVPVPTPVAFCDDESVTGAPFYVMGFVDGRVLGGQADGEALSDAARAAVGRSTIETLAALHAVDPAAVGLDDLDRGGDYAERQLKRWLRQARASEVECLDRIEAAHDALLDALPSGTGRPRGIVHGDFRPGNISYSESGQALAVFDWELASFGDPLADLGWLVASWKQVDDDRLTITPGPSGASGFWTRDELADHYESVTGTDVGDLGFYVAFAFWRIACVGAGVRHRYLSGVMGRTHDDEGRFSLDTIAALADTAVDRLRRPA